MKKVLKLSSFLLIAGIAFSSCKKDEETDPETQTTDPVEEAKVPTVITDTAVTLYWDSKDRSWAAKGSIGDNGGSEILSSGICWATSNTPTINDSKVEKLSSSTFNVTITGLNAGSNYYIRAYATNEKGTGYGDAVAISSPVADGVEGSVTDADGNSYKTVTMRGKEWMAENLKTTKLSDGTPIKMETMTWDGATTPFYTYYDHDKSKYEDPYGAIYNYYCVETEKLCPTGWHVSTTKEWEDMVYHWGGQSEAAAALKEKGTAHFRVTQPTVTNESKLTLLPGGRYMGGRFDALSDFAIYWKKSDTQANGGKETAKILGNGIGVGKEDPKKHHGFSVRCVKD